MTNRVEFSILIPAFNSEKSLPTLIPSLCNFFESEQRSFEIIVVDDASRDATKAVLETLKRKYKNLKPIFLDENVGQQKALFLGLKYCYGDFLITMDDDLQHPVSEIKKLIRASSTGADLIFGIYEQREDVHYRRQGSHWIGKFFKWRYKALEGMRVSSFRLISKSIYAEIAKIKEPKFVYLSAELIPFAQKILNVTVERNERVYGKSGYDLRKLFKLGLGLIHYYGLKGNQGKTIPKTVLMVGAGSCQINGIIALKKKDCTVIVADYAEHSMGKRLADIPVLADAFDPKAIFECASFYNVDGIITVGTDQPLLSVVKASEQLDLPHFISSEIAYKVTNKREMKKIFTQYDIPTVAYAIVRKSFKDNDIRHIKGPYVVKPIDSQGQRGIYLLDTPDDIRAHFDKVLSFSREEEILVEAFYPNEEITVSGWVEGGLCKILTITDRVTFKPEEHIGVCVSHEYPSKHFEKYGERIKEITESICTAFRIESGPIYFQMLVGAEGVLVNEIACRLGGAYEDVTIPWATGVDVLDLNIRGCLGESVSIHQGQLGQRFFSTQLFFCEAGQIKKQTPIHKVRALDCVIDAGYNFDIGDIVPLTESASARAGFVIITGETEESLRANIQSVFEMMLWTDVNNRQMIRKGSRNER